MSKKTLLALAIAAAVALPVSAFGQIGIGVRGGTLGAGGEVAVGVGKMLQIRGGIGSTKLNYDGTFNDKTWHVETPPSIWNVGVDLFPMGGGFHVSGGIMNRKQFDFAYTQTGSQEVGNTTYNGTIHIAGNVANANETAFYAGLGFGRTSKKGFGVSFDLGAASMGDATVSFTEKTCQTTAGPCPSSFNSDVETERQKVQNDIGSYFKVHPILSLALHYGFGK